MTSWRIGEIEVRRVDSANFVLPSPMLAGGPP